MVVLPPGQCFAQLSDSLLVLPRMSLRTDLYEREPSPAGVDEVESHVSNTAGFLPHRDVHIGSDWPAAL